MYVLHSKPFKCYEMKQLVYDRVSRRERKALNPNLIEGAGARACVSGWRVGGRVGGWVVHGPRILAQARLAIIK